MSPHPVAGMRKQSISTIDGWLPKRSFKILSRYEEDENTEQAIIVQHDAARLR